MEIDHIVQKDDGGPDTYDNAITVCFDCHAEIHHYNPAHPKGRRFRPDELKAHRDQWLSCCAANPAALASFVPPAEGGALERLLNELMFNEHLSGVGRTAAVFEVGQFRRAIGDGTFGWLKAEQASAVYSAYALISEINNRAQGLTSVEDKGRQNELSNEISSLLPKARVAIGAALKALRGE
ncbi:HNH endonuclease [bacterium]|nr:MAG: HNH endonuclease [bacterium]